MTGAVRVSSEGAGLMFCSVWRRKRDERGELKGRGEV